MKLFLKRLSVFILAFIGVVLLLIFAFCLVNKTRLSDLPALKFSNSYSFNEKIIFLKRTPLKPEIVALGSSMTQNNLYSEKVVNYFSNENYLNLSSWGFSLKDILNLLKFLNRRNEISKLLIVSNVGDLQYSEKKINYDFVESYLDDDIINLISQFLKEFDFSYYKSKINFAKSARNNQHDYEYLGYDKNGMVKFFRSGFEIEKKRWEEITIDTLNYRTKTAYLDSVIEYCKANRIDLFYFQSPIRGGLAVNLTDTLENLIDFNTYLLSEKVKNSGFIYVDGNEMIWNDSLFVDAIHFDEQGAKLFTDFCFNKIERAKEDNTDITYAK